MSLESVDEAYQDFCRIYPLLGYPEAVDPIGFAELAPHNLDRAALVEPASATGLDNRWDTRSALSYPRFRATLRPVFKGGAHPMGFEVPSRTGRLVCAFVLPTHPKDFCFQIPSY